MRNCATFQQWRVFGPPRDRSVLDRGAHVVHVELDQEVEHQIRLAQPVGQFFAEEIIRQATICRCRGSLRRAYRELHRIGAEFDRRRAGELLGGHAAHIAVKDRAVEGFHDAQVSPGPSVKIILANISGLGQTLCLDESE